MTDLNEMRLMIYFSFLIYFIMILFRYTTIVIDMDDLIGERFHLKFLNYLKKRVTPCVLSIQLTNIEKKYKALVLPRMK